MDPKHGCLPCPKGTYSSGGREESCKPCPEHRSVGAGNGTSAIDCEWSKSCGTRIWCNNWELNIY